MAKLWERPIYKMLAKARREYIKIDVTKSCSPGLRPSQSIHDVADFFERKKVKSILDVGAGALRHSLPLLERDFQIYAVEYEEQYNKPACLEALQKAQNNANFTSLEFPKDFISLPKRRFDAALLCFVIPSMPRPKERVRLLNLVSEKLKQNSYIYWMSQYGKYGDRIGDHNAVGDGWFLNPKHTNQSFYTEFKTAEIDKMLARIDFKLIRFLGKSGHDQFRLFARGGGSWA